MYSAEKIKLIIWDLDETLWSGTLSDVNDIVLDNEKIELINKSLDYGIVHSICSKNDFSDAKRKLEEFGIWDLFVFPSIDWSPKGNRVKTIISEMNLRPVNVLFIDDNIQNLKEVEYYAEGIMTCLPSDLSGLIDKLETFGKNDPSRSRLKQYRILEEKNTISKSYESNEEFLISCNIQVQINKDCDKNVDRILDLLMRSNQLNYTKLRSTKQELEDILKDNSFDCGYVTVSDNFGDYGIVGFYAIKNGEAIHYLFSCRTLGMKVEQYVYMKLRCPKMNIVGDVITELNEWEMPVWINENTDTGCSSIKKMDIESRILVKGPCDMLQMFSFINENENIVTEFTYTNDNGILIEGHNHTAVIASALNMEKQNQGISNTQFRWINDEYYSSALKLNKFDYVFISLLVDANMGLYRNKTNGLYCSFCEGYYDLTNSQNWKRYISREIYDENIHFSKEDLLSFSNEYEFVNNNDFSITINSLNKIHNFLNKKTKMVLMLGSEVEFKKESRPEYVGREAVHRELNRKIEEWAKTKDNVILINYTEFIHSQNDYVDSINHFSKKVYYELARKFISITSLANGEIEIKDRKFVYYEELVSKVKRIARKILK